MHHFQADLSLTSLSTIASIQIYICQDALAAYIKWIRTPDPQRSLSEMEEKAFNGKQRHICCSQSMAGADSPFSLTVSSCSPNKHALSLYSLYS